MQIDVKNLLQQLDAMLLEYSELKDDEQLRNDMFEGSTDIKQVIDRIVSSEAYDSQMIEGIDQHIDQLKKRKERLKYRTEIKRKMIQRVMEIGRLRKLEVASGTVTISRSTASVIITDESLIDDKYWRIKKEINKTEIKNDMRDGITVNGAFLSNGDETVRITRI